MIYIFGGAFDPPHVGHGAIIRALLHHKNPEKIIIIPSSERDDKKYHVSDEHRLQMLRIFVEEIGDERVVIDEYFIKDWNGEMITRDVDEYSKRVYGKDIAHIFGTDTIESMPNWDNEQYAARKVKKIFIPRSLRHYQGDEAVPKNKKSISLDTGVASDIATIQEKGIENFELFTDSRIPNISSTHLRDIIPDYTSLKSWYENDPKFIIPGVSGQISRYILEHRLYRKNLFAEIEKRVSGSSPDKGRLGGVKTSQNITHHPLLRQAQNRPLSWREMKPRILVHVCCGPDVTMPILRLRDEYEVICFWYDPNIEPKSEYDRRFEAFKKVCEIENIPYIKGVYDVKNFHTRICGLELTPEKGEKCTNCYDMRMYVAAKLTKKLHIPYYTSSLNTSPKKDLEKLFKIGHHYAERFGIEFLDIPFRKRGGFEHSVEYTRKHDIYRQNYCGCAISIREGGGGG